MLFASYSALVWIHPIYSTRFVDSWNQNLILGERLMYDRQGWPRILVGSSMSLTLEQSELGDELYNLSFAGIGALTGLEVIRRLGLYPKEVVVEINLIQPLEPQLLDQLFDPVLLPLRRVVPALRSEYRTVNFILNWSSRRRPASALDSPIVIDEADPRARARMIAENQRGNDRSLTDAEKQAIGQLPAYVRDLMSRGTRVSFLELPMDPRIEATSSFRLRTEMIRRAFPTDQYRWIDLSSAGPFETRDGLHLLHVPAVKIARLLRQLD